MNPIETHSSAALWTAATQPKCRVRYPGMTVRWPVRRCRPIPSRVTGAAVPDGRRAPSGWVLRAIRLGEVAPVDDDPPCHWSDS
jgi:hypothetical protein